MNHRIPYRSMLGAVRQVATAAGLMLLSSLPAWPQASQVPNAKQQFIGPTGAAYDSGQVFMYVPNTFTKKSTWTGSDQATQNANPILLDSAGRAKIWGVGSYRQVLKDKNNLQVWDELTVAPPITSTAAASGAGDFLPLGAILPIAGYTAPTNYLLAFGQAVSRVTYVDALAALTISSAASCINSSATITGITSTAQMRIGAPVEASCLTAGTVIATIAGPTSITVTPVAAVTTTTTVKVFNWGNGDGVNTFNVPDLRGRVLPGADAIGGTAASRLISAYYGVSASPPGAASTLPAALNGSQTLVAGNLPAYTPSGAISPASYTPTGTVALNIPGAVVNSGTGGSANLTGGGGALNQAVMTATFTGAAQGFSFTGAAQGGASTPFSIVQPSITVNYAVKMLNGTLPTIGVLSFGGMTGDILCGSNLTCAGNQVSVSTAFSNATFSGGTINSTAIGQITPAAGNFSALTINGVPVSTSSDSFWTIVGSDISYLAGKASTNTPAAWTSTTQIATTAFVQADINNSTGSINIKSSPYNAACDGATDDSAAFNSARVALQAAGGGIMFIPLGTCLINSTTALAFTTGKITIQGTGPGSIIKAKTGASLGQIIAVTSPARLLMKNVAVDGNYAGVGTPSTSSYMVILNANDSELASVDLYNAGSYAVAVAVVDNTNIHDSRIHDNQAVGIGSLGGAASNVRIENNYFLNNYTVAGIRDSAAINTILINYIISGNNFYNNFNIGGGQLAVACGSIKGVVTGNMVTQAGTVTGEHTQGIEMCSSTAVVSSNKVENSTASGINIEGDITDVLVTGNNVFSNGNAFAIITSGCVTCPKKVSFIGNQIRSAVSGAAFSISTLGPTGNDIVIMSNYIDPSVTTPISGAGNVSMIMGNYGYPTIGSAFVLPTSCAGQPSGTLRNNAGVVNVCP